MARFCENCGHELANENSRFCESCGAEQKTYKKQNSSGINVPTLMCPHCGQETPYGVKNCMNCGLPIQEENNTAAVVIGYIVTFIFSIFGIIPAIYLLTRNNGKAKTQGLWLIIIVVVWIISLLVFRSWFAYVIVIILMIAGIYMWFNDYVLIE